MRASAVSNHRQGGPGARFPLGVEAVPRRATILGPPVSAPGAFRIAQDAHRGRNRGPWASSKPPGPLSRQSHQNQPGQGDGHQGDHEPLADVAAGWCQSYENSSPPGAVRAGTTRPQAMMARHSAIAAEGVVSPNRSAQASLRCCPGFRAAAINLPRKHEGDAAAELHIHAASGLTKPENGGHVRLP